MSPTWALLLAATVACVGIEGVHWSSDGVSSLRPAVFLEALANSGNQNSERQSVDVFSSRSRTSTDMTLSPNRACDDCKNLVKAVATDALHLKLNREEVVLKTQTLMQKMGVCESLDVECHVYDEVKQWCVYAGLINNQVYNKGLDNLQKNPHLACHATALCDATPWIPLPDVQPVAGTSNNGSVVLRLKLKNKISEIPRSEVKWHVFVQDFLNDIATFLNIAPSRLTLHQHQSDELTEVFIARNILHEGPDQQSSPEELARRLKGVLTPSSNAPDVPKRLRDSIDHSFLMQIVPVVVPVNVRPYHHDINSPESTAENVTAADCVALNEKSNNVCGTTFKCTNTCKEAFAEYHGKCMTKMASFTTKRAYQAYARFFHLCEQCTEDRAQTVKSLCFANITQTDFPVKCSLQCSKVFRPYYHDCLVIQREGWSDAKIDTVDRFNELCSKCTTVRRDAVKTICDTRVGHQEHYYPGTCTEKCSPYFINFYDECLYPPSTSPKGAVSFRRRCQVAQDGGVFFRLTLNIDITSVSHISHFKKRFVAELTTVLNIASERIAVTGLSSSGGARNATVDHAGHSIVRFSPRSLQVDMVMRVSQDVQDEDPGRVVDRLRYLVSNPLSTLFIQPLGQYIDTAAGVDLLVPHTHILSSQPAPTSLELAEVEYQKAREAGLPAPVIQLRELVITYHNHSLYGASYKILNADRANIQYQKAVVDNSPQAKLNWLQANVEYRNAIAANATNTHLLYLKAYRNYLRALSSPDTNVNSVNHLRSIAEWRKAQDDHESPDLIALAYHTMVYYNDVLAGADEKILALDKANVQYYNDVNSAASKEKLDQDQQIINYLRKAAQGA